MKVAFRHEIEIAASSDVVYLFFDHIAENYTRWHTNHVEFRWVKEHSLIEGAVASVKHRIHGKVYDLQIRFTKVISGRLVAFEWRNSNGSFFAPEDKWLFETIGENCRFVSESELVLRDVPAPSKQVEEAIASFRKHLTEEGENLKFFIETRPMSG